MTELDGTGSIAVAGFEAGYGCREGKGAATGWGEGTGSGFGRCCTDGNWRNGFPGLIEPKSESEPLQ